MEYTKQMLGYNLITKQTTKKGLKVNAVLVHEGIDIKKEIYIAFILDRTSQLPCCIASKFGGMDIEEVAHKHPESIIKKTINPKKGLTDEDAKEIIAKLELSHLEEQAVE